MTVGDFVGVSTYYWRDLIIEAMTDIAQIQDSEYDAIKLRIFLR